MFVIILVALFFLIIVAVLGTDEKDCHNNKYSCGPNSKDDNSFFELFDEPSKHKDTGHCNGDCDNCPPHYGYRYGRWYYGHGHQHGCQRGGNGGASGQCYRD